MPLTFRRAAALAAAAAIASAPAAAAPTPPVNSPLDAPLFYQLLIGELELRAGQAGTAFEVILDAARRTRNEVLFRRAVDIALQARAGNQALAATRAWRIALPNSLDALRMQLQILAALNRVPEAAEPLRSLLGMTPEAERGGLITALPRFLQRAQDPKQTAELLDQVLQAHLQSPATATAAGVALGRGWLAAGDSARALTLAQQAAAGDPAAVGPTLLALELMAKVPVAERIVSAHLQRADAPAGLRLAYVRALTQAQRYVEAVRELEAVTLQQPMLAPPFLSLGALRLELRQQQAGEAALLRYIELAQAATPAEAPASAADGSDDDVAARPEQGLVQARLLLAQSAEQRGDFAAAERWLAQVDDPQRALEVQVRRASLMARQGQVAEARALIRNSHERSPEDARAKAVAEAALLRELKRWQEAYDVLTAASERAPEDTDLLYERAMMAEKVGRLEQMEVLLRRVIELKPDSAHAHNALGYSLADRSQRLPEARQLIQRALELAPGDPFITDSLGWVEYRLGNLPAALQLLQTAYAARPDTEIGAHLGEVLWATGRRDDARRVWRESRGRDATNDVLRETLARLKVDL
ncbi:MAG: tetratricopeptide repeat protein [Rubrivivax sp.]|nr:tetratricopeptide repeat protein [Rubrivivax sp.]